MKAILLLSILFPIVLAPLFFLLERFLSGKLGFVACLYALLSLIGVLYVGESVGWGESAIVTVPWVPSLGVNLSFIVDGLSLFFAILVTGMGVLVCWYAQYYMDPNDPYLARFYCFLMFFMGAMLGTVFSDNLLLLFCFWELTGVASFLLVGYKHPDPLAWKGARMAILVITSTSLALLAGILMVDVLAGTFNWHEISKMENLFASHVSWAAPIIICFLIGIFGKSAQFPFYFWLPNAMVAPTPISAYLHAATMVKLGIFLTARMYPVFVSHEVWFLMLTVFSFITLLLGAALSLLSNDLKAILAYATVSQLGFFLGFYGIGGEEGIEYDFVHILNHAFYKGSLFMLVGIVEHATRIRDIRYLGGLWSKLPLTTVIFFIAAGAMAGIPGTTGFLSKELILTDVIALGQAHHSGWLILGILIVALLFKVAFSLRLFYHLFVRTKPDMKAEKRVVVHQPSIALQMPPLILSLIAFVFGIWPVGFEHLSEYFYVSGLHKMDPRSLQIWHGWTFELLISTGILLGGVGLFMLADRNNWRWTRLTEVFSFSEVFERSLERLMRISRQLMEWIEPVAYAQQLRTLFALFGIGLGAFLAVSSPWQNLTELVSIYPIRLIILAFICMFALMIPIFESYIIKLFALSGSGFFIAIYFVVYEAPDLAMTQMLIEVATLLMILLLFRFLGSDLLKTCKIGMPVRILNVCIAGACGFVPAMIVLFYHINPAKNPLMDFFVRNAQENVTSNNIVNAILIDFRGLDTVGESTVLIAALMGVLGILITSKKNFVEKTKVKIPMNSLIYRSISPLIFVLINLFAVYLLMRGHDYPGGGFIAGLASGISLILVGLPYPLFERLHYLRRIGVAGLGVILVSGIIPVFFGYDFFTQYAQLKSWIFLDWLLKSTSFIFDFGVYMIVLAMVGKIYFLFRQSNIARG